MPPPKPRPTRPKPTASHDHDAVEEDRQIELLVSNADEDLANAVYTQAAEMVITNLVKVLEAINKRQHRNYPVVKFAMDVEKVLRDRAEQERRRLGKAVVWYLKPYCEMGRSVINKLRYDRSGRLIDITDTKDPVLLVEKLGGSDSSSSKKKGASARAGVGAAAAAPTPVETKKSKREPLVEPVPNKKASKITANSPSSMTTNPSRKRPRPSSDGGGPGGDAVSSDEDTPVTDLLQSKRTKPNVPIARIKTIPKTGHDQRKPAPPPPPPSGSEASGGGGGGGRILIPGNKPPSTGGMKITIPVKGNKGASNSSNKGLGTSGSWAKNSAASGVKGGGGKGGDSGVVLVPVGGGGETRSREAVTTKEEKLKKAKELVNQNKKRNEPEQHNKKSEEDRQAAFQKAQKERMRMQEEETRRRKEEERRRHERERQESAKRRLRAREEVANMERTIDFDVDSRALEELTSLVGNDCNIFESRMKDIGWEVDEEPYQGSSNNHHQRAALNYRG